jgi:Secretory lipase
MKKLLSLILLIVLVSATLGTAQNLISATLGGTRTKQQIINATGVPFIQFGAKYYRIRYTTPDAKGLLDTASALIVVPNDVTKVFPRLVYQHGTSACKTCVPSRYGTTGGDEGGVGLLWAGLGYISLLPDYVGMGDGRGFQTYVHAATEASAALDLIRASAQFFQQNSIAANDQLFITGYSQGGHAAMALARDIELNHSNEYTVTASAPLSGPYSISGVMRDLILSNQNYNYVSYVPNTILGYQEVYGNLYTQLSDVFKVEYQTPIQSYYNGTSNLISLNNTLLARLIENTGGTAARNLFKDSILTVIETDLTHPLNVALADNDTYKNWTPQSPLRIFYCMADDQVPFMNSVVARDSIAATNPTNFGATDVNPTADHGVCYNPATTQAVLFFAQFQQITTSTKDPVLLPPVKVSPNPAHDFCIVENPGSEARLYLMDQQGALLKEVVCPAQSTYRFDLQQVPAGLYTLYLLNDEGLRSSRVLKQ